MCLAGNEAAIIAAVKQLSDARAHLDSWNSTGGTNADERGYVTMVITTAEAYDLLEARVRKAEDACRQLGVHGPAKKADPAQTQHILTAK